MRENPKIKISLLNQFINFFWTILAFLPVIIFWWNTGLTTEFYIFLSAGIIFSILPQSILTKLQFKNRRIYERIGVKTIRKFVQNGDWVKSFAGSSSLINNHANAMAYMKTIAMYERYHWMCFVFFLLTSIYAFSLWQTKMASIILVSNIIYNGAAICLQHYNRIRVAGLKNFDAHKR